MLVSTSKPESNLNPQISPTQISLSVSSSHVGLGLTHPRLHNLHSTRTPMPIINCATQLKDSCTPYFKPTGILFDFPIQKPTTSLQPCIEKRQKKKTCNHKLIQKDFTTEYPSSKQGIQDNEFLVHLWKWSRGASTEIRRTQCDAWFLSQLNNL